MALKRKKANQIAVSRNKVVMVWPHSYVDVLTLAPQNVALFGGGTFKEVMKVK